MKQVFEVGNSVLDEDYEILLDLAIAIDENDIEKCVNRTELLVTYEDDRLSMSKRDCDRLISLVKRALADKGIAQRAYVMGFVFMRGSKPRLTVELEDMA